MRLTHRDRLAPLLLLVVVAQPCQATNPSHEEVQQRIDFADRHFRAGGTRGSHTDRGKAYIALGPPDHVQDHAHDPVQGTTFPWQEWTYRVVSGIGYNVHLVFVDPRMDNLYRIFLPSPSDAQAQRRFRLIQRRIRRVEFLTGER
jgi:GWxTD domain-containing protein